MKTSSEKPSMTIKTSRREALKIMALGGAGLFAGKPRAASAEVRLSAPASHKHAKIVVIGSGAGAMDATARIRRAAPNADITLIAPNGISLYEPGQIFVAAGLYQRDDIERRTGELLPDNVVWLREPVTELDPQNNSVTARHTGKIGYDFLIVALDAEYDYAAIDGLTRDMIGKNGIASVYLNNTAKGMERGGEATRRWFDQMTQAAASRPIKILCAEPDTPIKETGSGLDVMFLGNDLLRGNGPQMRPDVSRNAHFTFVRPDKTLFPSKGHDKALRKIIAEAGNIDTQLGQRLTAIDVKGKRASFTTGGKTRELPWDFIHITPPMRAPEVLRNSPLAVAEGKLAGWMAVDEKTLLHPDYPNVIGIGNAIATTAGRTVGSAREQAIVIQDNIASLLEGHKLPARYDGYTVARIKTRFGQELLAEFNDKGVVSGYGLNPYKPRWAWWAIDLYAMPWIYFNLMMRGMY